MKIKVINKSGYELPKYETAYSAGMDVHACIKNPKLLKPLDRFLVPTGIYIELPIGYEAQIRPRSGLALKHGITVLNTPGTIDADYRGQVHVLLINLSNEDFVVNPGDRIGQMIIAKHEHVDWEEVNELSKTERGEGGHGHTGIN